MSRTDTKTRAGEHREDGRINQDDHIIGFDDRLLITGANGFIGSRVVDTLLRYGFRNLCCLVRGTSDLTRLNRVVSSYDDARVDFIKGNLLSPNDCDRAAREASVIYHLAAGRGQKSYPDAFMNSVVTTRNLLDSAVRNKSVKRFVNISSFAVYSNTKNKPGSPLDETCQIEREPELRGEAYCYAKVRQDELVEEYGRLHDIPYVIIRPGVVYGPGNKGITGRVGIGTFGIFLHLGGSNLIPLTYVDNCAEAIVLAGIRPGVDGEVLNIVDDDLPTSRDLLKMYKKNVGSFRSIYLPRMVSYLLCLLWEKYSRYSQGQLPPTFNRRKWSSYWKGNRYPNEKSKRLLGWKPSVPFSRGAEEYFRYCRNGTTDD